MWPRSSSPGSSTGTARCCCPSCGLACAWCLAICLGQRKIGYVPKAHNSLPALLMHYGHEVFELRVLQVDSEADPWEQVRVGLYVADAR